MTLLLLLALAQNADVDAILEKAVKKDGPGAAVLVVKDGKVVYQKGYGLANLEHGVPITEKTVFELASCSKQFTAMGIMILHDRGTISIDDDVRKVLPEMPEYDSKRPIRIVDLLHHTSGIVDYLTLIDNFKGDPNKIKNEGVLKMLVEQKLEFPTGTKWEYSNSNYCLLALIIERLTKKSFGTFMREEIFQPLEMKGTTVFEDARAVIPNRAYGYARTKKGYAYTHTDYVMTGDGCVMTSIEDLVMWDAALRDGKLVKAETLKRAFTSGTLDDGTEHHYGFGWMIGSHLKRRCLSHGGSWAGASTHIARYVDDGLTVVVLSNLEDFSSGGIANKIARIYLKPKDDE